MSSVVHTLPLSRIRNPVWHAWTSSWKREIIKAQSCYKLQVHKSWWILCPHVSVPAGMNWAWWSLSPHVSLATGMNWAWWSLRPCVFLLPGVVSEVMKQISSLHFSWVLLVTPVNCMCQFTQKMQLLLINVTIYQLLVKTTEVFCEITDLYACNVNASCTLCSVLHSMMESGGPKRQLPPSCAYVIDH